MARKRDYYEVLGVSRSATAEEIRKAYRRLARKLHPDVNKSADAEQRFAEVTEAYEVLNDPEKRKTYDQFGHAGVGATPGGFGGGAWPGGMHGRGRPGPGGVDPNDLGSIFEEMFGSRSGPSPFSAGRSRRPGPIKGRDLEHRITVTFMTAALGGSERLRITVPAGGAAKTIDVTIPPGIEGGSRMRVKGRGQPGPSGGPPGDLILTVDVGRHPHFRREGLDVMVDVPITIAEAALGVTVSVPLLRGEATVKVPPGASSGRKLRLKGKGMEDGKGRKGDFFAVIQIIAPSGLSPRARELVEELSPELKNPRESGPWADVGKRGGD